MKKYGRPVWWLAVVVVVGMTMMTAGVVQAGPIKAPEIYGRWRLGDPGEPDGGKSRRMIEVPVTSIPVLTPYGTLTFRYSRTWLKAYWLWASK